VNESYSNFIPVAVTGHHLRALSFINAGSPNKEMTKLANQCLFFVGNSLPKNIHCSSLGLNLS
jgi:hypothetical protein